MKQLKTIRSAFTMLELIFVIIILGIVSSIGAEVIAKVYESYIVQRAQYRASTKTELALSQIANRLRYAIPGTVYASNGVGVGLVPITDITAANSDRLQWVAYDGDSFEAISTATNTKPGWSGFCDIDASGGTTLSTPGSNLGLASTIIGNLGGSIANASIFFPRSTAEHNVSSATSETITLDATLAGTEVYEQYKLAWSSYALTVEGGDLYLYYNFTPTVKSTLGNNKQLLLQGVDNFRFKGSEGVLRIKICKKERIGMDVNATIHACKEKVIF